MALSAKSKRKWRLVIICTLMSGVIGLLYALVRMALNLMPQTFMELEHAIRTGLTLGLMLSAFAFFFIYDDRGVPVRRMGFVQSWIVIDLMATILIVLGLLGQRAVAAYFYGRPDYLFLYFQDSILIDTAIAFSVFLLIVLVIQVRRLIGEGTMWKVVSGRYHTPRKENRIFMFVDIRDSTAIAEQIGDEKAHALVTDVFFSADRIITDHRGEILSYNGDEIVASWPSDVGLKDGRCLHCYGAISEALKTKSEHYQARFGVSPGLWVGIHEGPVVVGECGDSKLAIVHIGDTPNTAARLEQKAKELGTECLISQTLKDRLGTVSGFQFEAKGGALLRGHSHETELFAVTGLSRPDHRANAV